MSAESIYLATVLLCAMVSFYLQRIRPDVTALLVMLSLLVPWLPTGDGALRSILSPAQAFAGFGSSAVIMVAGMFVLSAAMSRTGAAQMLGGRLLERSATSELRFQITLLAFVTLFSAIINNTTTVLVWMPTVMAICRERGYSPSRVLMLLAFGSLLGGQWTLIGTRSNVILSDFLSTHTGEGLGFFAFTPLAALVFLVCAGWFLGFGRHLLPRARSETSLESRYEVAEFLTETMAEADSDLVGRTLSELDLPGREVSLLQIIRGGEFMPPSPWVKIQPGDVLVVQGRITAITDLLTSPGMRVREELQIDDKTLRSADLRMVEAILPPDSHLVQRSLRDLDFHNRYGVSPLAISRAGRSIKERPAHVTLRSGDSLLLVGHQSEIDRLRRNPDLLLLESRPLPNARPLSAIVLVVILAMMVLTSATGVIAPAAAIPMAAMAAVLCGCVGMRAAYETMDLQTLVIVGAIIPFGEALQTTGTAQQLASGLTSAVGADSPHLALGALLLVGLLLTQIIGNAAVAVILAPLAYEMALSSGSDPRPFFLGIAVCLSASFVMPIAHESTLLVMGPGRYRFRDFAALGAPFAILTWIVATVAVPMIWPLRP